MSNARPADPFNLCQFTFANGRLCGLPAHPKANGLCLTHARRSRPEPREDNLSAELHSPAGDFITQIDINHVLGRLFDALAANRVSSRRAGTLAYIGCLLVQTQKAAKEEALRWEIDGETYEKISAIKSVKPPAPSSEKPSQAAPSGKSK
jgi:hypothetical protein